MEAVVHVHVCVCVCVCVYMCGCGCVCVCTCVGVGVGVWYAVDNCTTSTTVSTLFFAGRGQFVWMLSTKHGQRSLVSSQLMKKDTITPVSCNCIFSPPLPSFHRPEQYFRILFTPTLNLSQPL